MKGIRTVSGALYVPFDKNNDTYKWLEKETALNRSTWRYIGITAIAVVIARYMGNRN
tara:strand:+ start:1514 stop:1684 length:171 start_codon:yes stop_codon:yes gene_type:complete